MLILNKDIHPIGDPHLGRTFRNGVLPKNRGVKERQLKDKFVAELQTECDYIVILGDLFDKFVVSTEIVLFAYEAIMAAALANPKRKIVVNKGNHDESRDINKRSSFQNLIQLLDKQHLDNIIIADDKSIVVDSFMGVVPWHPFTSPHKMVRQLPQGLALILTHNDTSTYSKKPEDCENYIALEPLSIRTKLVLNGHVHSPSTFWYTDKITTKETDGALTIMNIGSMLPLNFLEDVKGEHYVTLTLEEFDVIDDFRQFKNKSVRVRLKAGEQAPAPIDCLQFTVQVASGGKTVTETVDDVSTFNIEKIYKEETKEIPEEFRDSVWKELGPKIT